ncbi:porin [Roseateles koreensis]|uniref:Porin n=1 Tax=Roseateles koreensis TaxID=2987526 RepID=A0ABT5KQT3_9BURK|nr:porin [Roseateles koreensis]MDC8785276.1 porin [Roseateles koreensis]
MSISFKLMGATCALAATFAAQAESSSVTIYGSIDQYLNYMTSSSGAKVKALEDGALLRSRLGFRGTEDLGGGLAAKFQLEMGLSADTGTQADTTRSFDRQAWVGLADSWGEVRLGRQNGPIFARGGYIDHNARTLGSMVNVFGTPSRYDNDLSYISPRVGDFQFEGHVSLPEVSGSSSSIVYQAAIDYIHGDYRAGYMTLHGRPLAGAPVNKDVVYDNLYFNWLYGKGTVYLAYVRSNNNTSNATSNNGTTILGNVGGLNAGTNADLNNFYVIKQVSADYRLSDQLRVGALWGQIEDQSGRGRGANGGSIAAYYDFSKRTTVHAMVETIRNDTNGGWRPAGSAGLKTTFTSPVDINGRTIDGFHLGIVHRF